MTLDSVLKTTLDRSDGEAAHRERLVAIQNTDAEAPDGKPLGVAFWILAAVLSAACIVPVWLCEYFPSQNGPSLLQIAFMEQEFDNPVYGYTEFFELHAFPVPYRFQTTVLRLLFLSIEPLVAHKALISCVLLLRCAAVFFFLRCLRPGREIFGLACLALLYDYSLMRGYTNYHAGVSVGLIVFGAYVRYRENWTRGRTALFNVIVLIHYFCHPIALVTTGLLLATYEFVLSRSAVRILGIVLRGYLPSVVLLSGYFAWTSLYSTWSESTVKYASLSDKIQNLHFRGATPLSSEANFASLGLLMLVGGVAAFQLVRRYRDAGANRGRILTFLLSREPMVAVFLTTLFLYVVMPWSLIGWHKADIRLIPIVFLMLAALPIPLETRRARVAFSLTAGFVILASLFPINRTLQRWSDDVAEYVAGIEVIPMRSRILPVFAANVRSETWQLDYAIDPVHRADSYYTLLRGGVSTQSLARNNTLYLVWYKNYAGGGPFPKVSRSRPTVDQIREAASAFDTVLLWKCSADLRSAFQNAGFQTLLERGRLTVLVQPGLMPDATEQREIAIQ